MSRQPDTRPTNQPADQTDRRGPLEIKFGTRFSGSVPRFLAYTEQSLPTGFLTRIPCLHGTILAYRFPNSEGNVMTLTGWGVFLGLLVVAAIALIIRFVIRHRRGYD